MASTVATNSYKATKATNVVGSGQTFGSRNITKKKRRMKSDRAGLLFPVGRVLKKMRKENYHTIFTDAAVCMTAVLEYLVAEILELASNAARECKRLRLTPRFIQLAVLHDKELEELLKNVIIAEGGVLPKIQEALLSKKRNSVVSVPVKSKDVVEKKTGPTKKRRPTPKPQSDDEPDVTSHQSKKRKTLADVHSAQAKPKDAVALKKKGVVAHQPKKSD